MPNKRPTLALAVLMLLSLLLSACSGASPAPTATTAAATAVANTQPASPAAPTANREPCTAVSSFYPTPEPTTAAVLSLFKPISDQDWQQGKKTAAVTFIEYSDFQ